MNDAKLATDDLERSLKVAQLQKLELEIKGLRRYSTVPETLVKLTPLLSVLIAVGGLLWGIYQYHQQQGEAQAHEEIGQRIQLEAQRRSDLDQIVRFPSNKTETLSRTKFLLKDLNTLLQLQERSLKSSNDLNEGSVREVSKILYDVVNDDCDLDTKRDADFAGAIVDSWDDYKKYIQENPALLSELISKHCDSLSNLHSRIPRYVGRITYDPSQRIYIEPPRTTDTEQSYFRHFVALVLSAKTHLDLLDQNSKLRQDLVRDFQASTCNEKLTKELFNLSFDPRSNKEAFEECLRVAPSVPSKPNRERR
jgi:hypothetical protein